MTKVRFSCPRCQAVMQTEEDKIGFDIACPQCSYQFTLVEPDASGSGSNSKSDLQTDSDSNSNSNSDRVAVSASPEADATQQWTNSASSRAAAATKPSNPYVQPVSATSIPPIYQGTASNAFCCPFCQTRHPPIWRSEISTAGWITFAVLLVCTCFFFWVGFLIRDKYLICSVCKVRLPGRHAN